ncbi:MAG: transposase [Deltaproteobacteria bacterium]|jgi:putative transposase|nr:transposase [Deltaproteobacteria bacterium]
MLVNPLIIKGVYLISRKIDLGKFRLKPQINKWTGKDEVEQIVGYCLAVAQKKYNIAIYAVCVMSNHLHIVCRDLDGRISDFMADVHRNIAQCMNAKQKKKRSFWSHDKPGKTWLVSRPDLFDRILYVMLNPVKSGLVNHYSSWPGMVTEAKDFLKSGGITYKRPHYFFKSNGKMPKTATLVYSLPPGYNNLTRASFCKLLEERLQKEEKLIAEERDHKKPLGKRKILKQDPFSRPLKGSSEGGFNPAVACKDKELRIKATSWLKNFRISYRKAWERYRRGERDVEFPYGTFKLVREHDVRVAQRSREAEDLLLVLPEFA